MAVATKQSLTDTFGSRMRWAREQRGWSQAEFLEYYKKQTGRSMGDIQPTRIENGRAAVTLELAEEIAELLGVGLDFLLGMTENPAGRATELSEAHKQLLLAFNTGDAERLMQLFVERQKKQRKE